MTRRQERVEELLRREIAQMLMRGELRDPRLAPASAVSITGVEVSADLSVARVFIDVLTEALRLADVLAALHAGSGLIRRKLGDRLKLRRMPELRFEQDNSITRGARVEAILAELRDKGELREATAEPPSEAVAVSASDPDCDSDSDSDDGTMRVRTRDPPLPSRLPKRRLMPVLRLTSANAPFSWFSPRVILTEPSRVAISVFRS